MNAVGNDGDHAERHRRTLAKRQNIEQQLGVRWHFDEVVHLQVRQGRGDTHELKSVLGAVLPLAALDEQLRVERQAQTKQGPQVPHQAGKGRGVQVDPVRVCAPSLRFSQRPKGIDVD